MYKNVLVKNMPEDAWTSLRSEAVLHDMNVGEFIAHLIKEHKKKHLDAKNKWDQIINQRLNLTAQEWTEFEERIMHGRKTFKLER